MTRGSVEVGERWVERDGSVCVVLHVGDKTVMVRDETGPFAGESFHVPKPSFQRLWTRVVDKSVDCVTVGG